ncbi:nucleotide-diphospho-sugar transferase [Zopfochytrium polystomum]|nr:nucleotide-diphospho-sugar transferase [Zopfochytrium polystomum]
MFPLTEDPKELPKALLPVGNKPMIYYQLQWLENARIEDIIVVCSDAAYKNISNYVHKVYEKGSGTMLEVVKFKEEIGSLNALRHVSNRIKSDFLVLSCDIIINLPAHKFLDIHRAQNAAMVAMLYENVKGDEAASSKKDDETLEFIGIDHSTGRLLMTVLAEDIDEELPMNRAMLERYPNVTIHTTLRDAHLYVFKRWVIDLIKQSKLVGIKSDLIPLLLQCQYSDRVVKRESIDKLLALPQSADPFTLARSHSSTGGGFVGADKTPQVVCAAVVAKPSPGGGEHVFRAHTQWTYLEGNRNMPKFAPPGEALVSESAQISQKTQVGADAMVGEGTRIGERTGVKKSVIGSHCVIGKNVKIAGSVIMDHCVIEDNVKLDGCVVCNTAKIGEGSTLKDCQVAPGYVVEKDLNLKGEPLL